MKRVALVSTGYFWLPIEPGPSRFFYLANLFVNAGWDVEVITTSFQHFEKKTRDQKLIITQGYPFKITFLDSPQYKKNIDIRRIVSNRITAKNALTYLNHHINNFDIVYCSIPSNDVAACVSKVCKDNKVPFIVDIEDLWPEAMSMVLKNDLLRNTLLFNMLRDASTAYANASGVIGTSEDYTDRAFKKRERNIPYETVYVGCDLTRFDEGAEQYKDEICKPVDEFWVTYAGSIGTSYDIKTLVDAGKALLEDEKIKIHILGSGPLKEKLELYAHQIGADNVCFWGYVPYAKMAAVLTKSDVLVNSFVKGAPQSIVNKIGDYLAAGKPIINTLENPVFCRLINKNNVGVNIEPGNPAVLCNMIRRLREENLRSYCVNSRKLCESRFDRKTSYSAIIKLMEEVMEKNK